jgi:flagellar basal body-associated protein FliL
MAEFGNIDFGVGEGGGKLKVAVIRYGLAILLFGGMGAGGALLGHYMGSSPQQAHADEVVEEAEQEPVAGEDSDYSYYEEFEPVTVTLNEPGGNRFLRVSFDLRIKSDDFAQAKSAIEAKKRELTDWMIRFLSSLPLNEVRGEKSINRIRRKVQDRFNDQLWPKARPRINDVLIKEFTVQ